MTRDSERGAALPTIAIMMVVLLGLAAMAVDLGWIYLNANRLQKAADAAALAGVTNLPARTAQAGADAAAAAGANDFPVGGRTTLVATPLPETKLRVDMTTQVDTFFLNVLGLRTIDIAKTSTAQYILPVRLGSDDNCMGRDPTGAYCTGDPGFWVAISGSETDKLHGDAYTARCWGDEDSGAAWDCLNSPNPEQRGGGYYYGIEVKPGTAALTVNLYDAGFYDRGGTPFDPNVPWEFELSAEGGVDTTFTLRAPDTTPYDPSNNPVIGGSCTRSIGSGANPGTYRDRWAALCTVLNPTPGIYVLQVDATSATGGSNSFSIAATTSGPRARVYGINDMGLYNTNAGSTARINIAEIETVHAGKTLVLGLFDSGDATGQVRLSVVDPNGRVPRCSYTSAGDGGRTGPSGNGPCVITTSNGGGRGGRLVNGMWLNIRIQIPDNYRCDASVSNCFWKIDYEVAGGGTATDRTTWTASVIGNPVRLVPNT